MFRGSRCHTCHNTYPLAVTEIFLEHPASAGEVVSFEGRLDLAVVEEEAAATDSLIKVYIVSFLTLHHQHTLISTVCNYREIKSQG